MRKGPKRKREPDVSTDMREPPLPPAVPLSTPDASTFDYVLRVLQAFKDVVGPEIR